MDLGKFSLSLAVADINAAHDFYTALGVTLTDGAPADRWLIMTNGQTVLGLFQGMFESNLLTVHPGDVRAIQAELKPKGIAIDKQADETTTGPAHMMVRDPDGNIILFDQH